MKVATPRDPVRSLKPRATARVVSDLVKIKGARKNTVSANSGARSGAVGPPSHDYVRSKGIDEFVAKIYGADPIRLIETERRGVAGIFIKDLSKRMEIPAQRMFAILGVPKATAEKKVAAGELLSGSGGRAALGIAKLFGMAQEIVGNSTAAAAKDFNTAKWLGQWLEKPQPALGGRKPAELIDTPTGLAVVARLLGAIESGAYQ